MTLNDHLATLYQLKASGKPYTSSFNAFVSHLRLEPDLLAEAKAKLSTLGGIAPERCFISGLQAAILAEALSQL